MSTGVVRTNPCRLAALLLAGAAACSAAHLGSSGGPGGGAPDYGGGVDAGIVFQGDLTNVRAWVHNDNALITFDPVDGARDYRVYLAPVLPDGGVDTSAIPGADGGTAMPNATYRCAGDREAPIVRTDNDPNQQGESAHTWINGSVDGYTRSSADATLGYVYITAGDGRVPVYAMGDPSPNGDNPCYPQRYDETRVKKYVTSDTERQSLITQGWRDYGPVFYVPAAGTAGTTQIYTAVNAGDYGQPRLYFGPGPELSARSGAGPTPAFLVLSAQAPGTAPLKRVYYMICGWFHDELVVGEARFQKAVHQGNTPVNALVWSGLTGPTQLVVEALDQGCPWQGLLASQSVPASTEHQAVLTPDNARAADPYGEVFINGQQDGAPRPRAIARSIVQISPQPADTSLDFFDGFDSDPGPFVSVPYTSPDGAAERFQSPKYDVTLYRMDYTPLTMGRLLNQFWVTWADGAHDFEAKFRMTANQKATLPAASGSYLHVTMEVDTVSTGRRYPQILISDQSAPVQDNLAQGTTIVVQTFGGWPNRFDIEFCNHQTWTVTGQCPRYATDMVDLSNVGASIGPAPVTGEFAGVDRPVRWDVYASTDHVYAFLDGQPAACAILPTSGGQPVMAAGPVTVTFGDVLYHSGIDVPDPPYTFHQAHLKLETQRHLDNFGWKSGVAAPAWNDAVACTSTTK